MAVNSTLANIKYQIGLIEQRSEDRVILGSVQIIRQYLEELKLADKDRVIPFASFTGVICKGDKQFNSHCGTCEKCQFMGWTK